ncbi:MAG: hypothetical protein KAH84_10475 [Thiomargarita sp.]|nr:hypothetical protein [Thiomargarita sp.]
MTMQTKKRSILLNIQQKSSKNIVDNPLLKEENSRLKTDVKRLRIEKSELKKVVSHLKIENLQLQDQSFRLKEELAYLKDEVEEQREITELKDIELADNTAMYQILEEAHLRTPALFEES